MGLDAKDRRKDIGVPSIEALYQSYRHKLIHFFAAKGLEQDVAEDLSQEVFFRFLRCDKTLENEDHARNLLFRIAQNLLIDYFRKHNGNVRVRALSSEDLLEEDFPRLLAEEQGPEDIFVSEETSQDINAAVSKLPLRYAQAIMLKEYKGLSYREIAAQMGVSQKAVESLLHRARSQLKDELVAAGEKRGGWWSGILLGLRGIGKGISLKPFRNGIPISLGAAGAGKGIVNVLTVIILLGSVVGTGVAATVIACRDTHDNAAIAEGDVPVFLEDDREEYMSDELQRRSSTPSSGGIVNAKDGLSPQGMDDAGLDQDGGLISSVPARIGDLINNTTGTVRQAIVSVGGEVDLLLASLGKAVGILTGPVVNLLVIGDVPAFVIDPLLYALHMEALRDVSSSLLDSTVEATYILDDAAALITEPPLTEPTRILSTRPVLTDPEEAVSSPQGRDETIVDAIDSISTAPDTSDQDSESGQSDIEEVPIVEGLVDEVVDLMDDVTEVVRRLLPLPF